MQKLDSMQIDTSGTTSDLCILGAQYCTDKSPYNSGSHRHPYTAVYEMLFGSKRYDRIVFGELGIAYNASMRMWREYFPNAEIYGFEFRDDLLKAATEEGLHGVHYLWTDVSSSAALTKSLNEAKTKFDILIDDSSHLLEHQTTIIPAALAFMKPGGLLVIEDVFRNWPESRYDEVLRPYFPYFSFGVFIETNHKHRFSEGTQEPYFNNDKLLVLCRNQTVATAAWSKVPVSEIPLLARQ